MDATGLIIVDGILVLVESRLRRVQKDRRLWTKPWRPSGRYWRPEKGSTGLPVGGDEGLGHPQGFQVVQGIIRFFQAVALADDVL